MRENRRAECLPSEASASSNSLTRVLPSNRSADEFSVKVFNSFVEKYVEKTPVKYKIARQYAA